MLLSFALYTCNTTNAPLDVGLRFLHLVDIDCKHHEQIIRGAERSVLQSNDNSSSNHYIQLMVKKEICAPALRYTLIHA